VLNTWVLSSCTGSQEPIKKTQQCSTAKQRFVKKGVQWLFPLCTGTPGHNQHLNDFQKLASRLTFASHARSEVGKARPAFFISAPRIIKFYPQKSREWTNVLASVSYLSYTCHNTCPKVASYAEALWACHAITVYAYLSRKLP